MNNAEYAEILREQCYGSRISKIYWIAAMGISDPDLNELLSEQDNMFFAKHLPKMYDDDNFIEYVIQEELAQLMWECRYNGFLAEVLIPECIDFTFKNKKPTSWRVDDGICSKELIYAETINDLFIKMTGICQVRFEESVQKFIKSRKKAAHDKRAKK